jgi:hypothetical protein
MIQHGINLRWALGSTNVTVTGVTGVFQDGETTFKMEKNTVKDQRGVTATVTYFDPTTECNFSWYSSDTNPASGSAGVTLPSVGTTVTIVSTGPGSGSIWLVDEASATETNTEATKCKMKATAYTGNNIG